MWTLGENRSVYAVQRPERAGHGLVTVLVDDLDGWLDRIAGRRLQPDGRETYANGGRKATFRDPDGNEVGFGGAPVDDAAAAE